MASNPAQELQEEFLNTIRKSQDTVIDAIKSWVETVQSITPKVPSRRQAAQARGSRGQRLRLRRATARQPAEVRRRGTEGDDLADAGQHRQHAEGLSR